MTDREDTIPRGTKLDPTTLAALRVSSHDLGTNEKLSDTLKHIRGELTAIEVLVANFNSSFVVELQKRISHLGEEVEKIQRLHSESIRPVDSAPESDKPTELIELGE